jgi:hypothetical protein
MVSHTNGFFFVGVPSIVNVDLLNEVDILVVCSAYGCIVVEVDVDARLVFINVVLQSIFCTHIHHISPTKQEKKKKKMG